MIKFKGKEDSPIKALFNSVKAEKYITEDINIVDSVEKAKQEWEIANSFFENVSDPALIDYAIYNIEAAEKRYVYLIKQAKHLETVE